MAKEKEERKSAIHWFPGHMAKATREIEESVGLSRNAITISVRLRAQQHMHGLFFNKQVHRSASYYRSIPQNCISHHRGNSRCRGTIP